MAKKAKIVKGEDATFTIKLRDEDGDPFDLSGFDQRKVCFVLETGDTLEVTQAANANGSIVNIDGNALLGKLQVILKAADSAALKEGERQDLWVELNVAATPAPRRTKLENSLTVVEYC